MKKKDVSMEMLRFMACLFVIMIHSPHVPYYSQEHGAIRSGVAIATVIGDANAIFYTLTGCFLFQGNKPWKQVLLSFVKGIYIPAVLAALFLQIFGKFFSVADTAFTLDMLSKPDFALIIRETLKANPGAWSEFAGPYWYIATHGFLLLWYPIIAALIQEKRTLVCWGGSAYNY